MNTHTETEIRKSFVNCSKGAAQRINIPQDVLPGDWESQIFLGWYHPKSPRAGYVVVETERGLARMCQICLTLHPASGVSLVSIQRSKTAKDRYNSVGAYVCSNLACSDYTLGRRKPEGIRQMEETMRPEERADRALANMRGLVERVAEAMGK